MKYENNLQKACKYIRIKTAIFASLKCKGYLVTGNNYQIYLIE
jgi:hypothetical protein